MTDRAADYQGKAEKVTHTPQIVNLLRRIRDNKVLLSVRVPGYDETFNSLILEVNAERNTVLLDELSPQRGHELICKVRELRARCQCQGVELSFACNVEIGQSQRGISFYRAPLPSVVNYLQRRSDYRVHVGAGLPVPMHLPIEGSTIIDGGLTDLSMGGLGANIKTDVTFKHGQIIDSCKLELPKGESFDTEIEICFVRTDTQRNMQHIGAAFRNIQPQQEQILRRFVTQLEREMLRKKIRE